MGPFAQRDFRLLFSAQIVALLGTGLTTVALGLLAYEIAGSAAAVVLGTALTIKMVLYVVIAPLAAAYVDRLGPGAAQHVLPPPAERRRRAQRPDAIVGGGRAGVGGRAPGARPHPARHGRRRLRAGATAAAGL